MVRVFGQKADQVGSQHCSRAGGLVSMDYEVLFYNGWIEPPAYYLVASATGDTPEQALQKNLAGITRQVRRTFGLNSKDISDARLQETIYLLRA
jgi:hypothetical protein